MINKIGLKKVILACLVVIAVGNSNFSYSLPEDSDQHQGSQQVAQEETVFEFRDSEKMPETNLSHLIFRVFVMLGVILVSIVALVYLLKILIGNKKALFSKQDKYVQVIDRLNIESKKSVYLVKILDEILVVGAGTDSFTLLTKITDAEKVAALTSQEFKPLFNLFSQRITQDKDIANGKN